MKIETKEIYSEVYSILNFLGDEYIEKIPKKLFNMLEKRRNTSYNPEYKYDIPLCKQNVKKETIVILALLHSNYWCNDEKESNQIKQILKNNEEKYQEEIRSKYNPDNMFKKRKESETLKENIEQKEVGLIEYKESILRKIMNKIKSILKR